MASRNNLTVDNTGFTNEDILGLLFENAATAESPYTLIALAVELGADNGDILKSLGDVDEDFVGSDALGNVWLEIPFDSKEDMLKMFYATHSNEPADETSVDIPSVKDVEKEVELITATVVSAWENPSHDSHMIPYVAGEPVLPGFTRLPEPKPEDVKPCPAGVNPNFWELAWYAPTMAAKRYWLNC